jgi:NADPH:quinone reductase-like Zn-dependent oxidoreductase
MFAVYASEGNIENPLASLVVGERPDPIVSEGWVRVKVSHASLKPARHLHLDGRYRAGSPPCLPDDSGK